MTTALTETTLRLDYRAPLDTVGVLAFLGARSVGGIEITGSSYARLLDLPHGPGFAQLRPADDQVVGDLELTDPGTRPWPCGCVAGCSTSTPTPR